MRFYVGKRVELGPLGHVYVGVSSGSLRVPPRIRAGFSAHLAAALIGFLLPFALFLYGFLTAR